MYAHAGVETFSTLSREVKGPGVGRYTIWDLNGVLTFLLIRGITDLHPGHLRCATDPHLLRGGDLISPVVSHTPPVSSDFILGVKTAGVVWDEVLHHHNKHIGRREISTKVN